MTVKAKKHLGQHFLNAPEICQQIADELKNEGEAYKKVLEIGPGMGALTTYLLKRNDFDTYVIDIDTESIDYLKSNFPDLKGRIFEGDFLKEDFDRYFGAEPFAIAGNFPYNISSQILFKIVENRDQVPEVVGMFQKEVAERVAEGPGKKAYGILSVFLQAFYDIRYCFTVDEHVFTPPPKVKSGVIRMVRNQRERLDCDEELFKRVVKMAFNQRRKTLRNSLKPLLAGLDTSQEIFNLRPERLSVDDFIELTNRVDRK
ncbi:16S rRNA (adenine(1518)-N(6)/adenine(1519)-N(6)) -dimethyltransferase RsmA [Wandonia haliotis]|uniref:Ribosomal RNA small subunit methyltransferase A n=1 Tax=Wandonia haliotis TaxID=574963 RepID=A0ABP3Y5C7_9FLAO